MYDKGAGTRSKSKAIKTLQLNDIQPSILAALGEHRYKDTLQSFYC